MTVVKLTPKSIGLLFVLVAIGLPLFVGLARWDMGSDEAIYSYAVERILETNEWLTPRSIPSDEAFFEKPPLKFWIVAGAMRAGLVPETDAGMRVFDALFGVAAFVYVYLLGVRLGGAVCGASAALILFAFGPLVFEHGLRSNNMEAALVLAYAGGVFHVVRWIEAADVRTRRREALLVSLFFVLGFMTKFVAALFLPVVGAGALAVHPRPFALARERWRDWIVPVVAAGVLVMPWFVYESLQPRGGRAFWHVIVGEHVYRRLAGVLIPEHLHPWYYYLTATWRELFYARATFVVSAGLLALAYAGWWKGQWLARVVLLWFVVPFALISLGTSKLLHYAYPFIAPLALGGGLLCAFGLQILRGRLGARLSGEADRRLPWLRGWRSGGAQAAFIVLSVALVALAVWTALNGPVTWQAGGVRLFRNGSVVRPLVLSALCLGLTGWGRRAGIGFAVAVLLLVLPLDRYFENVRRVTTINHPLRTIRDCVVDVHRTSPQTAAGVLRASGDVLHHSYYYYMRHTGQWVIADPPDDRAALQHALSDHGTMPVLVTRTQQKALSRDGRPAVPGVLVEDDVAMLLPGPFAACVPRALAAGARPLHQAERSPVSNSR